MSINSKERITRVSAVIVIVIVVMVHVLCNMNHE